MLRFDEYSDAFKDLRGFRPRGSLAASFLSASEAEQEAKLSALYGELAEELALEDAAKAAFEAKLAGLGLDPTKYGYLWETEAA